MAGKSFKAIWLGDEDPHSQIVTEAGLRFIKGEPTSVPADLEFNGMKWADNIRNNPTFSIEDDEDPVDAGEEAEIAELKETLDGLGVKYRANASLESLRGALAEKMKQ